MEQINYICNIQIPIWYIAIILLISITFFLLWVKLTLYIKK